MLEREETSDLSPRHSEDRGGLRVHLAVHFEHRHVRGGIASDALPFCLLLQCETPGSSHSLTVSSGVGGNGALSSSHSIPPAFVTQGIMHYLRSCQVPRQDLRADAIARDLRPERNESAGHAPVPRSSEALPSFDWRPSVETKTKTS